MDDFPRVRPDQAGTYVQISRRLRIQRGPGKPDLVSERPRTAQGRYLDEDKPTTITFEGGELIDVDELIRQGSIMTRKEHRAAVAAEDHPKKKDG